MAVYAAIVTLKRFFSKTLHYQDAALEPEMLIVYKRAYTELKWFQDFVDKLDSRSRKTTSASLRVVEVAIYVYFERFDVRDYLMIYNHDLLETLKEMREVCCSLQPKDEDEDEEEVVSSSASKMIGLYDLRIKLKEALLDGRSIREAIILVHGMADIGKTALARVVFEDLDIVEYFERRAWVTLSYEWKPNEVMEIILTQVDPDAHKMVMGGDEEEIAQQLIKRLKMDNQWLIVVDDVWNYHIFLQYMHRVLFNNTNIDRVLLTTRIKESGYDHHWYPFEKQLLNEEESWELLCEKVFAGGMCPPQLEKARKKIADKCDSLPLTIVTVALLLSEVEESLWIEVAEKKNHQLFVDAYGQIVKVLYPSYKQLRDDLKLGFLYMGVFPLKHKIHRSKLFNLWTAEQFFNQSEERDSSGLSFPNSLSHFDDCSLIMVYQTTTAYSDQFNSHETIRTCRLHSSWWHLCQREVRKTNFFYVLDSYQDGLEEGIKSQTRLSMHNNVLFALKDVHTSMEENCASTVQTLLCFGPYNQFMVPVCFGLKLLQRLDAVNIRFYDSSLEVLELVKLMYLALTCNAQLPPSISKLEKLKYLIFHTH